MRRRTCPAATYLFVQGALTVGWWVLLWWVPTSRTLFRPADYADDALLSFWLADLVCVGAGSFSSGYLLLSRKPTGTISVWFTSGAIVYGSLYCFVTTLRTSQAVLATLLMTVAAGLTTVIAIRLPRP